VIKLIKLFLTKVNIVIHSAATVRFDEQLRLAVNINIIALQDILKISQEIKNLKVKQTYYDFVILILFDILFLAFSGLCSHFNCVFKLCWTGSCR